MEKYERFTCEGTEILRVRISLPTVEGVDAINTWYDQLSEAVYAFCQGRLLSYARVCFENDPDPRRHVRFAPFRYRLWGEVCYWSDTLLSMRIEASLMRDGANGDRKRFLDAHNFSLPDGALLSPYDALSLYLGESVSKKQCKKIPSLLLSERTAFMKQDGAWTPLALSTLAPRTRKKERNTI